MLWHWCNVEGSAGPNGHKICQRMFKTSFKTKWELLLFAQSPCTILAQPQREFALARGHCFRMKLHMLAEQVLGCGTCVCVCARILEQVLVVCAAYSTLIVYVCIIISIGERSSTSLHEACPKLARFWTRSSFQAQFPSKTKVWLKRPANSFERNSHWDQ